jgi:hypothetical protein
MGTLLPKLRKPFVGFLSPSKTIVLTLLLLVFAVCPLLSNFGDGLVHTAFFYTLVGYPLLTAASIVLLALSSALLPLAVRALLKKPAIEISADRVRLWGMKWREYPLSCVAEGTRLQFGNLFVRCSDGGHFTIPLWLYRDPQEVLRHLTENAASTSR